MSELAAKVVGPGWGLDDPRGERQAALDALVGERDRLAEVVAHAQKIERWGWGEGAPDLCKKEWAEFRAALASMEGGG